MLQSNETASNRDEVRQLQGLIEKGLEQADHKWKQRAKQSWYQKGNRNTTFTMLGHLNIDGITRYPTSKMNMDVFGQKWPIFSWLLSPTTNKCSRREVKGVWPNVWRDWEDGLVLK